jgi:hypothetical protein
MMTTYVAPNINLGTWDLNSDACGGKDTVYMENLAAQALEIAGAKVNVFRMLGIHEQGLLQDLTGSGNPISSGSAPGYLLSDAFNANAGTWQSSQVGPAVLTASLAIILAQRKLQLEPNVTEFLNQFDKKLLRSEFSKAKIL